VKVKTENLNLSIFLKTLGNSVFSQFLTEILAFTGMFRKMLDTKVIYGLKSLY
jgi:hypothetical protein